MNRLPQLSPEFKALNTAALVFLGCALLMALGYIDFSHMGMNGSYLITPGDIAKAYYGPGMSTNTLIGLAHIHMLGLFSVFWIVSYIFLHSTIALQWRIFWSVLPFAGFLIDVSGWFLAHQYEAFVYQVLIGGGLFILAIVVMILVSLYDMWIVPLRAPDFGTGNVGTEP